MKKQRKNQRTAAYLATRLFLSSSARAIREAAADAIAIEGFTIVARNGWLVKEYANGQVEKIGQLEAVKRPTKIVLD